MNTKEEVGPTKAHKVLSIAFPILMFLSSHIVFETTGFIPSAIFCILSIILIWRLPYDDFKLFASVIFVGSLIFYTPVIIYFIIRISWLFESPGLHS
ncbi:hypothetical protein [Planococcus shenhongbingii]|uniref:Uncharacterized protein n=1 Tax=Planococcus shenhongbingii TaxID=3058398 RepID=A0ABT8NEI7_9BACL|nr:hypothetical protein [Planococcus sp. N017]MDN7246287.1 hypothetical protein [Planococcus sp. N017]